ncbi:MAG: hypothetical protein ACHQVK_03895 [Candidatus Paceibacterales bacterium]
MKNNRYILLVVFFVLLMGLTSCGLIPVQPTATLVPTGTLVPTSTVVPTETLTPTPRPTKTPLPTPTFSAMNAETALISFGFAPDIQCGNGCQFYWNAHQFVMAKLFQNGETDFIIPGGFKNDLNPFMVPVFTKIYGPDVAAWVSTHFLEAKNKYEPTTINGFLITMLYNVNSDATASVTVTINPVK